MGVASDSGTMRGAPGTMLAPFSPGPTVQGSTPLYCNRSRPRGRCSLMPLRHARLPPRPPILLLHSSPISPFTCLGRIAYPGPAALLGVGGSCFLQLSCVLKGPLSIWLGAPSVEPDTSRDGREEYSKVQPSLMFTQLGSTSART